MPNQYKNKVVYGNTTLMDITDTTAVAADVAQGKKFYAADGSPQIGTASGGSVLIVDTEDSHGGIIREITTGGSVKLHGEKRFFISSPPQTITPDSGYDGFESAVIDVPWTERIEPKDVAFIDYDGTVSATYTLDEFLALDSLPLNPTHAGLISQGWNWTLADAKERAAETGFLDIGQMYTTDDGSTRFYIEVPSSPEYYKTFSLKFHVSSGGSSTIDWGDGDTTEVTSTTSAVYSHTYSDAGSYVVKVSSESGTVIFDAADGSPITNRAHDTLIWKAEFGNNITALPSYCFHNTEGLKYVTLHAGITINTNTFRMCRSLKSAIIPTGGTTSLDGAFHNVQGNNFISFPKTVTDFGANSTISNLIRLVFPKTQTNLITTNNMYAIKRVALPSSATTISNAFQNWYNLMEVTIPDTITSINHASAFASCSSLVAIHLKRTTPPTLSNVSAFSSGNANRVFYVPYSEDHSVLNAYKTATNWSTFASQMQEE